MKSYKDKIKTFFRKSKTLKEDSEWFVVNTN